MTHPMIAACGVLVAGTLTLSAQAPAPAPQTPRPSPNTPARTDDKTMTVTGCLKPADASQTAPAPSATPSTTAPASRFMLTNVEADTGSAAGGSTSTAKPSRPAPEESPAAGTMTSAGNRYILMPDAGVNLAAHVNHKVRITGTLSDKADTKTAAPAEPRAGAMTTPATIAVSAVTMVSATCTPATN